jgi:hypothetical protein
MHGRLTLPLLVGAPAVAQSDAGDDRSGCRGPHGHADRPPTLPSAVGGQTARVAESRLKAEAATPQYRLRKAKTIRRKHFANFSRQRLTGEWLLNERQPRLQNSVLVDPLFRVARHVQPPGRTFRQHFARDRAPAGPGQDDLNQGQMNRIIVSVGAATACEPLDTTMTV